MERRRDDSRNAAAAAEAESFALPAVELPPKVPATEPRATVAVVQIAASGTPTPATGGFLNIVLGEDRVAAAATAADKGSEQSGGCGDSRETWRRLPPPPPRIHATSSSNFRRGAGCENIRRVRRRGDSPQDELESRRVLLEKHTRITRVES